MQIGENVEVVTDFFFLGSKIIVDGDCSHEIRRWLLLGRKAMTNLDSVLKSRDITLPKKIRIVKTMVFPVIMYSFESWTVKKAEPQRIDVFELWCWRRLLRVPWAARRSNQSKGDQIWVITGRTDAEAEALVFWWSSDVNRWLIGKLWCWERLRAEGEEDIRGWDGWMASLMQWTWTWANPRWWTTALRLA